MKFTHTSPRLDPKLDHIMPIIASMGAGVSVVDFDRDGWNDLYFTNSGEGSKNALYRNNGDGTFTDLASQMGVAELNSRENGVSMGAVWGDFDNDGFEDLLVYKWGRTELYKNNGGTSFTRLEDTGSPAWANVNAAVWLDFDRDGILDIFLGGYFRESLDLWNLPDSKMMPESFEYARNGGRKYLLRGLGNGKFEDATAVAGIESSRWALAVVRQTLMGMVSGFLSRTTMPSPSFPKSGRQAFRCCRRNERRRLFSEKRNECIFRRRSQRWPSIDLRFEYFRRRDIASGK